MEVKKILIEYMEIVCGKIMSYPLESNHTDNKYLSQDEFYRKRIHFADFLSKRH